MAACLPWGIKKKPHFSVKLPGDDEWIIIELVPLVFTKTDRSYLLICVFG